MSADLSAIKLPPSLRAEQRGAVAVLRLQRAEKRNALNDTLVQGMVTFFDSLPADIRAVVLAGDGEHFSAGLDLTELEERDVFGGIAHSSSWHRAFDRIQFGKVPVVAV
ncbi:MAG: enoyl-CoA hydratase-related protein, partial [Xanthobacteraceae bacterium]